VSNDPISARLGALLSTVRFGKFASVGAAGAALETAIVTVLTVIFGIYGLFAKAVGAEASISLMFLLNEHWTFAEEGPEDRRSLLARYLRSHLVRAGGLALAFLVLAALLELTDVALLVAGRDFWPPVANLLSIGVAMSVNYVAESLFTWRVGIE
jgi:putative flippase GtrA